MFNTYEFTFAGESSSMYGMVVCEFDGNKQSNVSFGNKASIVESRSNNRIRPVHHGVNYHGSPLEFKLVFGSDKILDRYELEAVSLWLTGRQEYEWLTIDQPDMMHVQFRCLITELTPISHGWLPVAFEATVRCDSPYAYGYPFEQTYCVKDTQKILFRNDSSVREYWKPHLTILPQTGVTEIRIVNHSDNGREFVLSALPQDGIQIEVDNENGILQENNLGNNLYPGFNLNFLRMVQGDNDLEVIGSCVLKISGRFLYNVAG